jgi:hypothetical protein
LIVAMLSNVVLHGDRGRGLCAFCAKCISSYHCSIWVLMCIDSPCVNSCVVATKDRNLEPDLVLDLAVSSSQRVILLRC